jgi:hypothetical protein
LHFWLFSGVVCWFPEFPPLQTSLSGFDHTTDQPIICTLR